MKSLFVVLGVFVAFGSSSFAWECPEVDGDDAVYFEDDIYCNTFYECSNGVPVNLVCPPSTNWNQTLRACAFEVDCEGKDIFITTTTTTPNPETEFD